MTPIYIYFDLNSKIQTVDEIAASLLKQIAWPPQKDSPHLEIIYEKFKFMENRPLSRDTLELFLQCTKSIRIKVLFDALDECNDREIYELVRVLFEANIGVYITTKPHLFESLKRGFPDAVFVRDIDAKQEDIRGFLEQQIPKPHDARNPVTPEFRETIIAKIGDAKGMY